MAIQMTAIIIIIISGEGQLAPTEQEKRKTPAVQHTL